MSARNAVAAAVVLAIAVAAACAPHPPAPRGPTGEPVPTASTSAEPLWLRNRP